LHYSFEVPIAIEHHDVVMMLSDVPGELALVAILGNKFLVPLFVFGRCVDQKDNLGVRCVAVNIGNVVKLWHLIDGK